jgi:hypothetical protein
MTSETTMVADLDASVQLPMPKASRQTVRFVA